MKTRILILLALALLLSSALPVYAATTVTVTPSAMGSWFFYDDGNPGGIGNMVAGPGTPPLGTGSVHFALPTSTARETIATTAYAGTPFAKITNLQYSTYRNSVDAGNNLAVTLQFDVASDLSVANPPYQGRLVFEPYLTAGGGSVPQNTWQTWNPLAGKWYGSRAPFSTLCPMSSPCTWSQVLANWPNGGLLKAGSVYLKAGGPWAGFDGNADALTIGVNGTDTTYDFEPGTTGLAFVPTVSYESVGGTTQVLININSVTNLYGYQFEVDYDATKATASATFVNTWFNSVGGQAGNGWDATCNNTAGYCRFGATLVNPASPVNGSGTVALITFTGVAPGTTPLTFASGEMLTDRNANLITHVAGTGTLNVYGTTTVTGTVTLQGRATPITSGTITLTDESGTFAPIVANFDPSTGVFTVTNVPALAGGTTYDLLAAHPLYLSNKYTGLVVTPGGTFSPTPSTTKLLGGDATNDGKIDISDLSCIGGDFGGAPSTCGGTGSSDINGDTTVNILDLVLAGGNYGFASPEPW